MERDLTFCCISKSCSSRTFTFSSRSTLRHVSHMRPLIEDGKEGPALTEVEETSVWPVMMPGDETLWRSPEILGSRMMSQTLRDLILSARNGPGRISGLYTIQRATQTCDSIFSLHRLLARPYLTRVCYDTRSRHQARRHPPPTLAKSHRCATNARLALDYEDPLHVREVGGSGRQWVPRQNAKHGATLR